LSSVFISDFRDFLIAVDSKEGHGEWPHSEVDCRVRVRVRVRVKVRVRVRVRVRARGVASQ